MKRLVVFVVIFMALPLIAATIRGSVRDKRTGRPVPGAEVQLQQTGESVSTGVDGKFLFAGVHSGACVIVVYHGDYETLTSEFQLKEDGILLRLKLSPLQISEEVTVTATRAVERVTPVVFTDVPVEKIREEHTVQDLPMLLSGLPNVYAYSDDGSGMGYSYLKVRGFDQKRVGVMINGIPLNDPEDHQVYWVDMPDFAESLDSIQFQRGVGSSLYGVDAFGGSVNLITRAGGDDGVEFYGYGGSYSTWKTGLSGGMDLSDRYHLTFRASRLVSDGYRDNSGVRQWSGYLALSRFGERSVTQLIAYTGNEVAHAAWEASPESALKENHRHNPIEYDNTIDNFTQPHYELHHTVQLSEDLYWKNTLFYIHGRGFYEQYKDDSDLWEYGLWPDPEDAPEADLIRQKWVKKNQYGVVSELGWNHGDGDLTLGTYFSSYNSHHWGEVDDLLTDQDIPAYTPQFVYHRYFSDKKYATVYLNELVHLGDRVVLMANLHFQHMSYGLDQQQVGNFAGENLHSLRVVYNFWNPRFGVNVNITDTLNVYANVSVSHREPADSELFDTWMGPDDLGVPPLFDTRIAVEENGVLQRYLWFDPEVKPEKLLDYELGTVLALDRMTLRANLFYMDFDNEIVPYGQVDDDGFPIRGNAEATVHRGAELSGQFRLPRNFELDVNFSFNDNYYKTFLYNEYDWYTGETVVEDLSGNTIAGFPDIVGNATLAYRTEPFTAAIRWQHFGRQYLDNTENENRIIPSYNMIHAWFSWQLPVTGRFDELELTARFNNILNKKAYTAGYYDAWAGENYYWPSAGFHFTLGFRVRY